MCVICVSKRDIWTRPIYWDKITTFPPHIQDIGALFYVESRKGSVIYEKTERLPRAISKSRLLDDPGDDAPNGDFVVRAHGDGRKGKFILEQGVL